MRWCAPAMEHPMALWNIERRSAPLFAPHAPARYLDLAVFVALGPSPCLLLPWLIPLPLVLPALSIVSFTIACVAALFAHYSGVDRHAPGITFWDVAAVFTLMWIGAGMIGGSKQFIHPFEQKTLAPYMSELFAPTAIAALFQVVLIDLALAGDNAIVVGMAAAGLPQEQRTRAILVGMMGATALLVLFAGVTTQLLKLVGLQFAGGLLLLWVCW